MWQVVVSQTLEPEPPAGWKETFSLLGSIPVAFFCLVLCVWGCVALGRWLRRHVHPSLRGSANEKEEE